MLLSTFLRGGEMKSKNLFIHSTLLLFFLFSWEMHRVESYETNPLFVAIEGAIKNSFQDALTHFSPKKVSNPGVHYLQMERFYKPLLSNHTLEFFSLILELDLPHEDQNNLVAFVRTL